MAADEVLLRGAAGGVASLRFYGWEPATVSLGYFQPAAPVAEHPRLGPLPLVRRASGGDALVHHLEVTYALALPAVAPWLDRRENWLRKMHHLLRDVLAAFDVACASCQEERRLGPILCFQHHTPEDLLVGDCKVVGSAQRRQRDALLQHGGILLAQSLHTPELPGIRETTGIAVDPVRLQEAVAEALAERTGATLEPGDWSDAERQAILELSASRYATDGWNRRR
jgi:lipoate-protein ligase A